MDLDRVGLANEWYCKDLEGDLHSSGGYCTAGKATAQQGRLLAQQGELLHSMKRLLHSSESYLHSRAGYCTTGAATSTTWKAIAQHAGHQSYVDRTSHVGARCG